MIYLLNIFIYLLTPLGGVLSYCSLLIIAFDAIFGALLFLQCLFSLHMFVFMLPWIFSLRNFSLWHFMVPNVGYNPDRVQQGQNPLQLDSRTPRIPVEQSMYMENRFKMLTKINPETAKQLLKQAQEDVNTRWQMYQYLAARKLQENHIKKQNQNLFKISLNNQKQIITIRV
jgi:hypothetical protein